MKKFSDEKRMKMKRRRREWSEGLAEIDIFEILLGSVDNLVRRERRRSLKGSDPVS